WPFRFSFVHAFLVATLRPASWVMSQLRVLVLPFGRRLFTHQDACHTGTLRLSLCLRRWSLACRKSSDDHLELLQERIGDAKSTVRRRSGNIWKFVGSVVSKAIFGAKHVFRRSSRYAILPLFAAFVINLIYADHIAARTKQCSEQTSVFEDTEA